MRHNYQRTILACFIGYVVQAVINNFIPLLFLTFQRCYGIPLGRMAVLVSVNFVVQLAVDLLAARYVDRIGYRPCILTAHALAAAGLFLLPVLPRYMDPFAGILTAVAIYAAGGGLLEVLVSPIMESCPTDHKGAAMSLLHSFYCWGHVGVVLLSTLFFHVAGVDRWPILACLWALIPVGNFFLFLGAPIAPLVPEDQRSMTLDELCRCRTFWILMAMMLCAGAAEQGLIQWASAFAEDALHLAKTAGDLAGPMGFAVFMGISRWIYGKYGQRIDLDKFFLGSSVLCVGSYLLAGLTPHPLLSLLGCALCGLSVGILWPGTYSKASAALRSGGTAMFALLAVAGDLGCSAGPALVGMAAELRGGDLRAGILCAALLPVLLLVTLLSEARNKRSANT